MTFLLAYWRLGILAVALLLYPAMYVKGRYDGARKIEDRVAVDKARANSEARQLEQRRQDRANEAVALAATRTNRIVADAANARALSDGLRSDLDATKRYAAQSSDAAAKSVAALSTVFESCTRRYLDMAEAASKHSSDSLTYQESWPR